ncbi:MAG: DUF4013 domain-containing protein [Anaerolineae bacterium]|nr:DUF4013 domain-containing protein [Anaerolineae bacterium]
MDFGRALSFPFDDEEWPVKVILGTLLSLVPFFAQGYQVRVARGVVRGEKRPLPSAERLGEVFVDGVVLAVAAIIYFLPLVLIGCVLALPAILTDGSSLGGLLAVCAGCCVVMVALLYAIPALMLTYMGMIRYAETGNFSEYFRLGALIRDTRQNAGTLVVLVMYVFLFGLLAAVVAPFVAVFIVGVPLVNFYYHVATGHLIGQAGRMIVVEF